MKWFGQRYLALIRSVPSTIRHQTLPKRCSVPSSSPYQTSEIENPTASATSAPPVPGQHVLTATGPSNAFPVFHEFERPRSGTLNTSPLAMQWRFGYTSCRSSSSEWLWCDNHGRSSSGSVTSRNQRTRDIIVHAQTMPISWNLSPAAAHRVEIGRVSASKYSRTTRRSFHIYHLTITRTIRVSNLTARPRDESTSVSFLTDWAAENP